MADQLENLKHILDKIQNQYETKLSNGRTIHKFSGKVCVIAGKMLIAQNYLDDRDYENASICIGEIKTQLNELCVWLGKQVN